MWKFAYYVSPLVGELGVGQRHDVKTSMEREEKNESDQVNGKPRRTGSLHVTQQARRGWHPEGG
jgi:hypothetical protein